MRLLITAIVAYALLTQGGVQVTLHFGPVVLSVAPTTVSERTSIADTVQRIDRFGILANLLAEKEESAALASDAVRERFHARLNSFAQPLSFANVFLLAAALYMFFRRERGLLIDHVAFSMHFVSFVLLSSIVLKPGISMLKVFALAIAFILAVSLWQFIYLAIAIRRFYFMVGAAPRWPRLVASVTGLLLYLLNSAFLTAVQILSGAIALRSL